MKKRILLPQFVKTAASVLLLAPIPASAAPDDLFVADNGDGIIYKYTPGAARTIVTVDHMP